MGGDNPAHSLAGVKGEVEGKKGAVTMDIIKGRHSTGDG